MSDAKVISEPKIFFGELGGLHDAVIKNFFWNKENRMFGISIDDLNSNFLDLPEYGGLRPVEIVFKGVRNLDFDMQIDCSSFSIFDLTIEGETCFAVDIKCSPGGYMMCQCDAIELIDKNAIGAI